VFLSHQQTFGTTPTACIRFAVVSQTEILHILLEHSYDSHATRTRAQLADLIGGSQTREARICSVRSDSSSGGVAVVGSVAHLVAKDPGGLLAMSRGDDRGKVHTRDGREAYPRCLAGGSSDRTVKLWDWPPPVNRLLQRLILPQRSSRPRRFTTVAAEAARLFAAASTKLIQINAQR
jgi:hypothetical protein